MENGAIKHPLLVEAMEIVEKVRYIIYWHFSTVFCNICGRFQNNDFFCSCKCLGGFLRLIYLLQVCEGGYWFLMSPFLPMSFLLGISTSMIMWGFIWFFSMRTLTLVVACSCSYQKVKNVRDDVRTYANTYNFTIVKDWCGINELSLCSGFNTTSVFTSGHGFLWEIECVVSVYAIIVISFLHGPHWYWKFWMCQV